ncbi:MAG TPA: threonine synthase [Puia sp.]|nr:threonine synthase [Puia sp.]
MNYYSLNNPDTFVDFKEATIRGQAPDKGLYFPERIPPIPAGLLRDLKTLPREDLAFRIIRPYVGNTLPESDLHRIVAETINFDFPLVPVIPSNASPADTTIFSLELFHGPTLAFKDVGARFMSRCLAYFVRNNTRPVTVLVATSGDTGGAVASGFYDIPGIRVVILYPSGKVSSVQELQLTTLGKNITALEVDGSFDDCQRMVKEAFADPTVNNALFLTSANSINVARWLPQQFYYFFALQQWQLETPPVISVPSGNFGNICAGLLAHRSGLPVRHFIAACNTNDIVPAYLRTGDYRPKPAVPTLSNAMDVGNPSNFVRILELFHQQLPDPGKTRFPFPDLHETLSAVSISDPETIDSIRDLDTRYHYLADPHGAVGCLALQRYLNQHPGEKGFFLETAHPVKFYDTVEPIIGRKIPLPASVATLLDKKKRSQKLAPQYDELKDYLLS